MPAKLSRSVRWAQACSAANEAISQLLDMQSEFEEWRDNLPENLQFSAVGGKLEAICDLDLSGAQSTIEEAERL